MSDAATSETPSPRDLVAAYGPRIFGLHVRLIGRRDVAEDLTQETLLRALGGLASYRPEGKFQAWIFRIALNVARDWIRRRPREPVTGTDPEPDGPPAGRSAAAPDRPEAALEERERAARVEAALARLPVPDREVLLMRYYGDLAFKDIAEATGEPLGTVLARAHRALKKLGDLMPADLT